MSFISVIVPVFNRSHLLTRTIESIRQQTYRDFEILIIDDHSTENIRAAVEGADLCHYTSLGHGVSAARNTGIQYAKGNWIAFLDSDDEWAPHKLEQQVAFLQQNPDCRFVHTNEIWMRHHKKIKQLAKHQKFGGHIFEKCTEQCVIATSSVLLHKDLLQDVGMFDESFIVCEDFDLWLRISAKEDLGFLTEELTIKHGGHSDQLSLQHHSMDLWRVRALAKHIERRDLSIEQRTALFLSIERKAKILINGYKKHPHKEHLQEVQKYLMQVRHT